MFQSLTQATDKTCFFCRTWCWINRVVVCKLMQNKNATKKYLAELCIFLVISSLVNLCWFCSTFNSHSGYIWCCVWLDRCRSVMLCLVVLLTMTVICVPATRSRTSTDFVSSAGHTGKWFSWWPKQHMQVTSLSESADELNLYLVCDYQTCLVYYSPYSVSYCEPCNYTVSTKKL